MHSNTTFFSSRPSYCIVFQKCRKIGEFDLLYDFSVLEYLILTCCHSVKRIKTMTQILTSRFNTSNADKPLHQKQSGN